jgi:uncharacterized protein YdhG (YjbR/CyaY superfamily)
VGFAAFKNHCSIFPYSTRVMDTLKDELSPYDTSGRGATIRFPPDKPLPDSLIKKLVKVRIEEIENRTRK